MKWLGIAAIVVMLLGVGFGGFLASQKPAFWLGMVIEVAKSSLPVLADRMSLEKEKEMLDCIRRGGEWDHFKKRCRK